MAGGTKTVELKTRVGVDGETTYKDALKNIGRQLSVLKSEMKAATSAFAENENSVEALTAKQKALGDIQKAHAEKVKVLTEMLEIAKKDFGENSDEADQYRIKLANAQTALNKCTAELDKTGKELEDAKAAAEEGGDANEALGESAGEAAEAVDELGEKSDDTGKKGEKFARVFAGAAGTLGTVVVAGAKTAAVAMAAVTAAAAAAVTAGYDMAKSAGQYADNMLTLSSQTGVAQESLQKWAYTSNFIDTSVDTMTGSMSRMIRVMGDAASGNEGAAEKFASLGVSITDANGQLRNSEDTFWDVIDALGEIGNPTERDAAAMAIFGKSAQELNPLIEAGSKAYREMGEEAERLGTVFSDEEMATLGGFDDTMQRATATTEGLKNAIGLALVPAFQPLVSRATSAMAQVSLAIRDGIQPGEVKELTGELLDEASGAFDDLIGMIGDALPEATEAIGGLVGTLATKLPGMIDKILPAAMGLLNSVLNAITSNAGEIGQVAGQLVGQLASFLIQNLPQIASAAWGLVTGLMSGIADGIGPAWEAVSGTVEEVMGQVWDAITGVFGDLAGILENVLGLDDGTISEPLNAAMDAVKGYFGQLWSAITGTFGTLGEIVSGLLNGEISVGDALEKAISTVKGLFGQIWSAVTGVFGNLGSIIKGIFGGGNDAKKQAEDGWESTKDDVTGVFKGVWNDILGAFGSLTDFFGGIFNGVGDAIQGAWNAIKDTVGGIFGGIWDQITGFMGDGSVVHEADSGAAHGGGGRHFEEQDSAVADSIVETALASAAGNIEGATPDVTAAMQSAMRAALDAAQEVLSNEEGDAIGGGWMASVSGGITGGEDSVAGAARSAMNAAQQAMRAVAASGAFHRIGLAISQGIAAGIRSGQGIIVAAATGAARLVQTTTQRELDVHSPSRRMMWVGQMAAEGIARGMEEELNRIGEAARALSSRAITDVQTVRGGQAIDYEAVGRSAAAALRPEGRGEGIDYDRLSAAVAQGNREAGLGNATIRIGSRAIGEAVEPEVNSATMRRSSRTIAGRPARILA